MSKSPYEIILHPMMTEKSSMMRVTQNKVAFIVRLNANKIEIRHAIEKIFKVRVADVHTQILRGKVKRVGRTQGKRPNRKKAIVTLHEGERIEFFETTSNW
jgi:large subunit ribosomal protein L23